MNQKEVELLSPAGDFETALAAFGAGADAVYCGLADFSARAFAKNFTGDELRQLVRYARANGKKVYVTFNTLLDEDALEGAVETLATLEEIGPDALIVQDLGVAQLCRTHFPGLTLHASTQLVAHNLEGVLALKDLGFTRVVLARELSLEEIRSIALRCGELELEVFIHGALCYSLSGLCLFGAMEKDRSGNRGKCPYCCRQKYCSADGKESYPFSMKDLRLGEDARRLSEAGVASLKIEGRMKSALYVASVTSYYRQILDAKPAKVSPADLETVFSRRTTELYFNGRPASRTAAAQSPIDSVSLGHLGAEIGSVKRVTKDRDGLAWLRFHTVRALEKHDGLQFEAMTDEGRHAGLGISEMRQAISRRPVFEVNAGTDVEILIPEATGLAPLLKPGMKIYCSMSNAVKRKFPAPSFRPADYRGSTPVDIEVVLKKEGVSVVAEATGTSLLRCQASVPADLQPAKNPEKTFSAIEKAFSKFGETDYCLGRLKVDDAERLFAPMSVLNDLRRDLVERLDDARAEARRAKIEQALNEEEGEGFLPSEATGASIPLKTVKIRVGQKIPAGSWDEVIVSVNPETLVSDLTAINLQPSTAGLRLALPVYTAEPDFNKLRSLVKRFLREGFAKWECADLATLRMLKALGVTDMTADWTLYAFNSRALGLLAELGVRRFVASPENGRENLQYLAESGFAVEFLVQQSTPLFISLTKPMSQSELAVFSRDALWVTTRSAPRSFEVPEGTSTRIDLSWDPPSPAATEDAPVC